MFVNQLNVRVTTQQHGEIVKPSHYTLQLYAVHEEHRHAHFFFADFVQEDVLNILVFSVMISFSLRYYY